MSTKAPSTVDISALFKSIAQHRNEVQHGKTIRPRLTGVSNSGSRMRDQQAHLPSRSYCIENRHHTTFQLPVSVVNNSRKRDQQEREQSRIVNTSSCRNSNNDGSSDEDSQYGKEEDSDDSRATRSSRISSDAFSNSDAASSVDSDSCTVGNMPNELFCSIDPKKTLFQSGPSRCKAPACSKDHKKITENASRTSQRMKEFALNMTSADYEDVKICSAECEFGRNCIQRVPHGAILDLKRGFWGLKSEPSPLPKERKQKLTTIFSIYEATKHPVGPDGRTRISLLVGGQRVCEAAFLILLGYHLSKNASDAPSQWRDVRKSFLDPQRIRTEARKVFETNFMKKGIFKFTNKTAVANAWFNIKGSLIGSDSFATEQGATSDGKLKSISVLPWGKVSSMYTDFIVEMEVEKVPENYIPSYHTFKKAFIRLRKTYRLMRCKGSFPTCEICNNADALLRNRSKNLSDEQRLVVLAFKRLHLRQQSTERQKLENRKNACRKYTTDGTGKQQPIEALIYSDAMTESMGSTPKVGSSRHSKPGKQIKNRLFTVQVICGAACQFYMNVSVDQLIAGGANLAIEIQRVAIETLATELAKLGQELPKIINFQFDNCGENKNKEMFAFFASVIELEIFDEIRVNFLIVGHTHSNLDQFFSVYSKKIRKSEFIASPLAMQELYNSAHNLTKHPEFEPRRHALEFLRFTHDWVTFFGPILNKKLKWYKIPHCFRLTRVAGRAICQTQVFSPEDDNNQMWTPLQPLRATKIGTRESDYRIDVEVSQFASVQNSNLVLQELGVTAEAVTRDLQDDVHAGAGESRTSQAVRNLQAFQDMRNELVQLELNALSAMMNNMDLQRDEEDDAPADAEAGHQLSESTPSRIQQLQQDMQRRMLSFNNKQEGYILWLDYTKLPNGISIQDYLNHRPPLLPSIPPKYRTVEPHEFPFERVRPASQKQTTRVMSLDSACADIVNVSKQMIEYGKTSGNRAGESDLRPIRVITNNFQKRIITSTELAWFRERASKQGVWYITETDQANERDRPWALVMRPEVTDNIARANKIARLQDAYTFSFERQSDLQKERYNRAPQVEPMSREGRAAPARRGYRCFVPTCSFLADEQCADEDCKLWVCAQHGPAHSAHTSFATDIVKEAYKKHLAGLTTAPPQQTNLAPASETTGRGQSALPAANARSRDGCKTMLRELGYSNNAIASLHDDLGALRREVKAARLRQKQAAAQSTAHSDTSTSRQGGCSAAGSSQVRNHDSGRRHGVDSSASRRPAKASRSDTTPTVNQDAAVNRDPKSDDKHLSSFINSLSAGQRLALTTLLNPGMSMSIGGSTDDATGSGTGSNARQLPAEDTDTEESCCNASGPNSDGESD